MMIYLPAQRPAVHADGRRRTWMYETRNETVLQRGDPERGQSAGSYGAVAAACGRSGLDFRSRHSNEAIYRLLRTLGSGI